MIGLVPGAEPLAMRDVMVLGLQAELEEAPVGNLTHFSFLEKSLYID